MKGCFEIRQPAVIGFVPSVLDGSVLFNDVVNELIRLFENVLDKPAERSIDRDDS